MSKNEFNKKEQRMTPDEIVIISAGLIAFIIGIFLVKFWLRDPWGVNRK
ncbi:MAG TPA: hypothetical protein P5556_09965 [Candidatus Gastranaerophilales bacterium]|nr:hypothetical protein [Candidatus Gastranaerophilales bacterium]